MFFFELLYIGYAPQEIVVGNRTIIDLELIESFSQLDEVVVTALGITRKEKYPQPPNYPNAGQSMYGRYDHKAQETWLNTTI